MNKETFVILASVFIISGCSSGIRFFVSPYETAEEMRLENDIGQRREILWDLEYRVLIVHKNKSKEVLPVQHYRPEHTFGNRTHPLEVSYEQPMTLGTLIIIKDLKRPIGIAIKKKTDFNWRLYWLQDSDIKDLRKEGIVYLPPYEKLPVLQN